jgi:erythromycin esterase
MMNRRGLLLGGTALAAAVTISGAAFAIRNSGDTRASDEVVAWLKANALPLTTAEPASGFSDLQSLRAIIGNARIVSMGEATHGTREFFQLKHRLIEYCVSELGFTVIGFEAEYGATLAVNNYVLYGKGNALDVVSGMGFWTWDTEEVVALVEWVRAWNLAHDRKVKFYGFDMQSSAASALHLLAYLERVEPHLAAVAERNLAPLVSTSTLDDFHCFPADVRERAFAQIKTVLDAFATQRLPWISKTSELDWHLARQSAIVLEQFARLNLIDAEGGIGIKGFKWRDQAMANNVRALLDAEGPGAKALLWAHNGHVQRTPTTVLKLFELTNMGSLLHAVFGDEMVVVGFAFNQGSFQAKGMSNGKFTLGTHAVGPAPEGFVDAALAATGLPLLALDLTRVPADSPVSRWMASKPSQRLIGAVFVGDGSQYAEAADPRDKYDVLMFVENATAARGSKRPAEVSTETGSNEEPTNLALAGSEAIPAGWRAVSYSLYRYAVAAADEPSPKGGRAVRMSRAGSPLPWGDGVLTQSFPVGRWRGQRLVFSAAVRGEASRMGIGAQLVVAVWPKRKEGSDGKPLMVVQSDGPLRSSRWIRQSAAVDIPSSAERVQISLVVIGDAAGWFGDLELEAHRPVTTSIHTAHSVDSDRAASVQDAQIRSALLGRHLHSNLA